MNEAISLEREVIVEYVRHLVESNVSDSPEARKQFCDNRSIHPKLLYFNPSIGAVSRIFSDRSPFERLADMSLRDWMLYHHHYVHQSYRYGGGELQQKWMGHDILKSPIDCWIYQELMFSVKPDVLIELGVMFGGASHFYASIFDLIGHGEVLGVDISLAKVKSVDNPRIRYIEGSSTDPAVVEQVRRAVEGKKVLVIADSDHEKGHVLREMKIYSDFVPVDSYYVAEDSLNDVMGWHPVPNEGPQAAVHEFLREDDRFVPDLRWAEKYILTLSPYGFLRRVK
jgi:cephalosporin hydroxylase